MVSLTIKESLLEMYPEAEGDTIAEVLRSALSAEGETIAKVVKDAAAAAEEDPKA